MPLRLAHNAIIERTEGFEEDKAVMHLPHISLLLQRGQAEIRSAVLGEFLLLLLQPELLVQLFFKTRAGYHI